MKKIAAMIVIALGLWACVGLNPSYRQGAQAEMNKHWEEAVSYYEKASLENPKEPVYRLALERARFSAGLFHVQEARKLLALGKKEEAKAEYAKAIFFNPRDTTIAGEARAAAAEAPQETAAKKDPFEFPIKLKAKEDSLQLKFPVETSLRSIFLVLGKTAGVSLVFDAQFRDVPFTTDLVNMTFVQALRSLCNATKNFYRIVDERTVLILPDNPMNRIQYDINCIKTFYLSNVSAQEMVASLSTMLRSTGKVPSIIADKNLNSITVRDTPQVVELAEKLIKVWDKPKGEVVIDLEIMEVSRTKLKQLGVSFSSNAVGLMYGSSSTSSTSSSWLNLKDIDLSKAENFSINLPSASLQILESDSDTKLIAQPRLRGVSDEEIDNKVGQKIPMPMTTFSTYAAGGVNNVPITSYNQQDVGIEIKIKPQVHFERDVTLSLEIKVTSLGGTGYADIPIINNREIKNVMRLKDGETNLIAGLLRDEERKSLKGVPWLKNIPVLGRLFGAEDTSLDQSDVILTITPYIIRTIPVTPNDEKPLWVDVDEPPSGNGVMGLLEEEMLGRDLNVRDAERALQARRPQDQGGNQIQLLPANFDLRPNVEFRVAVNLRSDQEIGNMSVILGYDPKLVSLKDVAEGGVTRQSGDKAPFLKNIDNNSGVCTIGYSSPASGKGFKGAGTLATLVFETKAPGEGYLSVANVSAMSAAGGAINLTTSRTRIVVH
ncbi:MAG: secretin N-terminal domain-containing protein [Candidatus Aminicenantales bacterium]|jgi:general secretion pathway protein D